MYTQNQALLDAIKSKGVLIAAHRGTCGGNVIQNTTLAYKNALLHGADMIEIDAAKTKDGIFSRFTMDRKVLNLELILISEK